MDTPIDMLQVQIEKATEELPQETRRAINSVNWRDVILGMRERKGYTYEQLEDLELETELILCGLARPENYPVELERKLGITKPQADLLVNEMNESVFKKIREELIRNTEKKELFVRKVEEGGGEQIKKETFMEKVPAKTLIPEIPKAPTSSMPLPIEPLEKVEEKPAIPFSAQKLVGTFQMPTKATEYSLPSLGKNNTGNTVPEPSKADPYRLSPDE